jgi:type III pantothenate kinase
MILEMDFGNSRIKWRIRKDAEVCARGAVEYEGGLSKIKSSIGDVSEIDAIWIVSVLDLVANQETSAWLQKNFNLTPLYAESLPQVAGVTNGYNNPKMLGVDRWLAMIAAYNFCRSSCIVISAGTAVTVDLIDGKGMHLGGYIVPGWNTALKSLNRDTKLIKLNEIKHVELSPGLDTQSAVDHGLAASYKGLIEVALKHLNSSESVALIATGGDAKRLQSFFPEIVLRDELVLDGLAFCMFKT